MGGASGTDLIEAGRESRSLSTCPEVEAVANNGNSIAFACRDGFVVVGPDRIAGALIPYPAERKPISLMSIHKDSFMLGRTGDRELVVLDVTTQTASEFAVDSSICDVTLEIGKGSYAVSPL